MNLGKSIEWKDIEVGEVFAADGCLGILEKRSEKTAMVLAIDGVKDTPTSFSMEHLVGKILHTDIDCMGQFGLVERGDYIHWFGKQYAKKGTGFYQLDKRTQALWRTN